MKISTKTRLKKILSLLKPPLRISTADWADVFRVLSSEGSSEPGKWRTDTAPYQREILNAIDDGLTEEVTLMTSAQVGKTEMILNIIGKLVHTDPCPILLVQPTDTMAKAFSKERLAPMIRDTKILKGLIKDVNLKNSGNTVSHKMFPGGYIAMVGANSAANLASRSVRVTLLDEVDRFPLSAGKEGDPAKLAEKRTNNFWNRKKIKVSTPTIKGISRIDKAYENSTMEEYYVPCPSCGELQTFTWEKMTKETPIGMSCEKCRVIHTEYEWKKDKLLNGKWIANKPENKSHRGFHLNEFYSPWKTWNEIILKEYNEAKEDIELLKVWWNTSLGLPWIENIDEVIEWEKLLDRREDYGADLPDGVLILTCGIDVQDNRIEAEVVGWGANRESWGVEVGIFIGNPSQTEVWEQLDKFLEKKWSFSDGFELELAISCIDTGGHKTQETYKFVEKRQKEKRLIAIKGVGGMYVPVINGFNKVKNYEVDLLSLGTNALSDMVVGSLKVEEVGADYSHFPADPKKRYGTSYFKQLTAEKKVMKNKTIAWEKIRDRNEAFDMRKYALAGLELLQIDLNELAKIDRNNLTKLFSKNKSKERKRILSKGVSSE